MPMDPRKFELEMMQAVDDAYQRGVLAVAPAFIFARSDVPHGPWGESVWRWAKHKTALPSGDVAGMLSRGQCENILYDAGWERHGPGDWRNYDDGYVPAFPRGAA